MDFNKRFWKEWDSMKTVDATYKYFHDCLKAFIYSQSMPDHQALQISHKLLYQLFYQHHLGLLYHQLFKPKSFFATEQVVHYLKLQSALKHLVQQFDLLKISYIALKGIPLSRQLYGDLCVRHIRDLDILVKPHQDR